MDYEKIEDYIAEKAAQEEETEESYNNRINGIKKIVASAVSIILIFTISGCSKKNVEIEEPEVPVIKEYKVEPVITSNGPEIVKIPVIEEQPEEYIEEIQEEEQIEVIEEEQELDLSEYITFKATAYCSCQKCCGKWAAKNKGEEVKGAAGTILIPNCSVAIDNNYYKFGTHFVDTEGNEYIAADTGSGVKGPNRIDIYMNDHQTASNFGVQEILLRVVQ